MHPSAGSAATDSSQKERTSLHSAPGGVKGNFQTAARISFIRPGDGGG